MNDDDLILEVNTRNRDPRAACVLVIDVSGSMSGAPIQELERGYNLFITQINEDPLARKRAEIAVVTFGSEANLLVPFQEARNLESASFVVDGSTNMAAGIDLALDQIEERKQQYRESGIEYFRPWVFLLSDGSPNSGSKLDQAIARLNAVEAKRGVVVFAVGVGQAVDIEQLRLLSKDRVPLLLEGLNFAAMFSWLSNSMQAVSTSNNSGANEADLAAVTEQIQLSPPTWGAVA
ncbi:vWA domain-containing protein [Cryobacterium sp. AP23]